MSGKILIDSVYNHIQLDKEKLEKNELTQIHTELFNLSEFWIQFSAAVQALNNEVTKIGFMCSKKPFPTHNELGPMMTELSQYYTVMKDLFLVLPTDVGATLHKAVTSAVIGIMAALLDFVKSLHDISDKGAKARLALTGTFWDACNAVDSLPRDNLQATLGVLDNEVAMASDAQDELEMVSACEEHDKVNKDIRESEKVITELTENGLYSTNSNRDANEMLVELSTETNNEADLLSNIAEVPIVLPPRDLQPRYLAEKLPDNKLSGSIKKCRRLYLKQVRETLRKTFESNILMKNFEAMVLHVPRDFIENCDSFDISNVIGIVSEHNPTLDTQRWRLLTHWVADTKRLIFLLLVDKTSCQSLSTLGGKIHLSKDFETAITKFIPKEKVDPETIRWQNAYIKDKDGSTNEAILYKSLMFDKSSRGRSFESSRKRKYEERDDNSYKRFSSSRNRDRNYEHKGYSRLRDKEYSRSRYKEYSRSRDQEYSRPRDKEHYQRSYSSFRGSWRRETSGNSRFAPRRPRY